MTDVIVTGPPRSGLTLAGALIDGLPDAVCLNSPPWQLTQSHKIVGVPAYCKWLVGDFVWQRRQLLQQKPVMDHRAADGSAPLDGLKNGEPIPFTRPGLSPDFILAMRQHGLYTALLPQLAEFDYFKIIAVIRHPVDTLLSWQAQPDDRAIARGKLPSAIRFWPEAARISDSGVDTLERMVQLYDAHLERYHALRDKIHILQYEDIVREPVRISQLFAVSKISANAARISQPARAQSSKQVENIRSHFRKYSVFAKEYYPDL